MDNPKISQYRIKFSKLISYFEHTYIRRLADKRPNTHILFPNLDRVDKDKLDFYTQLLNYPNDNIIKVLDDMIALNEGESEHLYKLSNPESGINIYISDTQYIELLSKLDNVLEEDFLNNFNKYTDTLFDTYKMYGKKDGKYQSVEHINQLSKMYSIYDFDNKYFYTKYQFDNFTLFLELRKFQINLYGWLSDTVSIIIDSKNIKFELFKQLIIFINNHIINLIEKYGYDLDINQLFVNINFYLKQLSGIEYLELPMPKLNPKFNPNPNKDIIFVFVECEIYKLFCKKIFQSIKEFYDDFQIFIETGQVRYDSLNDPHLLEKYLLLEYDLYEKIDCEKYHVTPTPAIMSTNQQIDLISRFIEAYTKSCGNITLEISQNPIYQKIHTTLNKIRLMNRLIFPEFIYLRLPDKSDDQSNPQQIIFSKRSNPAYRNHPNYNLLSAHIEQNKDLNKIFELNKDTGPYSIFGLDTELESYKHYCSKYKFRPAVWDRNMFSNTFELLFWSFDINKLYLKSELVKNKAKQANLLYIYKKLLPAHFATDVESLSKTNLTRFASKYHYLGIMQIPSLTHPQELIICWNIRYKYFTLFEPLGNPIFTKCILYNPYITYSEINQISKYYEYSFYEVNPDAEKSEHVCLVSKKLDGIQELKKIQINKVSDAIHYKKWKFSGGGEYIKLKYTTIEEVPKKNKKFISIYWKKLDKIYQNHIIHIDKKSLEKYLFLLNPYEHIYPQNRLYFRTDNDNTKITIKDIPDTNNYMNILNYKFKTNASLFFFEINKKYNLIEDNFKDIYEITNYSFIGDSIQIINDEYFTNNPKHLITLYTEFTIAESRKSHKINQQNTIKNTTFININNNSEYINQLNKIDKIDFVYYHIRIESPTESWMNPSNYNYLTQIFLLDFLIEIYNKLKVGANMCLSIGPIYNYFSVKILTLFCGLFDKYYFVTSDINPERNKYSYLILKHKITNNMIEKILQQIKNSKKQYIKNIVFTDKNMKNLYKKVKKDIMIYNDKFYLTFYLLYRNIYDLYKIDKKEMLTNKIIEDYRIKNLFECIQWSKKYDFPLIPYLETEKFTNMMKLEIYTDIVSYEDNIIFKFKSHSNDLIKFKPDSAINFNNIPNYFNKAIRKNLYVTRALDYRDMNIYHQVKVRIDYYYKKLTKEIINKFNLSSQYVSQAWMKMTEMLHIIPIINKENTMMKSFHICELPGSFILALKHYIDTESNIKNWEWKAQSLNPKTIKSDDDRKAFGDEANLLKMYPSNYDFGIGESGDITDYRNIIYYSKKYSQNDLTTADCGLPYSQSDLSYVLSYATYLMIFCTTKKGGCSIVKRYVPISNNQEIYLLYLFYQSFEQTIIYKPKLNLQSQEYYLIGLKYKQIDRLVLDSMIEFLKNYKKTGFANDIPESFLLQVDKAQHILLDSMNKFINKKIYFCDNFNNLSYSDWSKINQATEDKIKEWLESVPIKAVK